MSTAYDIADWIKQIFLQVQNGDTLLPTEPILSFQSPLTATDDPTNNRILISAPAVATVVATAASGTTTLTGTTDLIVPFTAASGAVTVAMPSGSVNGQRILAVDVGLVTSTAASATVTFTSSAKFQDPDTMALGTSYVLTQVRNLNWVRVTSAVNGNFWAAT